MISRIARNSGWMVFAVAVVGPADGQQTDRGVAEERARPAKDVVVKAPPRCHRRSGDPADAVAVHRGRTEQRTIAPDRHNMLVWQIDREPVSGPAVWQRAGSSIGDYVFRVPQDGTPMCIGATVSSPSGWGQLRQIVKTDPSMEGKYLHFSGQLAARDADLIRFWLALGGNGNRVRGGDTHANPIKGTFGWRQVDIVVGPVPFEADHVSYGFLLWGNGDVWFVNPKLEVQTQQEVKGLPVVPTTLLRPPGERN